VQWLEGNQFVICENGTDTVNSAKKERFDLLILDVGLPDGDGLDFGLRILNHQPGLSILVVSAHVMHNIQKIDSLKNHKNLKYFDTIAKGEYVIEKIESFKIKVWESLDQGPYKKTS
jgi:CheY-like chemotaxis protein